MGEWQRITFWYWSSSSTLLQGLHSVHGCTPYSRLAGWQEVFCLCLHLSWQPWQWQCTLLHLASQGFWGFKLRSVDLHKSLIHCTISPFPPFLPLSLPPQTLTVSSLFLKVGAFSACFTQKRLPQAEHTNILFYRVESFYVYVQIYLWFLYIHSLWTIKFPITQMHIINLHSWPTVRLCDMFLQFNSRQAEMLHFKFNGKFWNLCLDFVNLYINTTCEHPGSYMVKFNGTNVNPWSQRKSQTGLVWPKWHWC